MTQGKPCLVGALGLLEHEISLIKSMLRHANDKHPDRYEWVDDLHGAHVAMVCTDNEDSMAAWREICLTQPAPVMLNITPRVVNDTPSEYTVARPLSPVKMVALLDKIYREKFEKLLEKKIFQGDVTGSQFKFSPGGEPLAKRALVVDDSPTVRKQLEQELGSMHIQVDMAETGEQCLEMIGVVTYDVIFLDVVLPGADGYDVCKKIRRNQQTKNTPVIMLTSKTSSFDRVRGAVAGCSSYLTKPVDYEKFHKVLDQYLGGE
jgi:two-component system, cell cycle response regulator